MNVNTTTTDFFLLGLSSCECCNPVFFIVLLSAYAITLAGDFLIILLVSVSPRLWFPMFYFLKHLSIAEILFTTNITPNMLHLLLRNGGAVSITGCIIQFYIHIASGGTESALLTIMSYDRYMAICNPLRYSEIMTENLCRNLVSICWFLCFTMFLRTIFRLHQLQFCGSNVINHFFCDTDPILALSCSDISAVRRELLILAVPFIGFTVMFIVWTYMYIFTTILKISTSTGRKKAFSTCSSHLASVCICYGPLFVIYLIPYRASSSNVNKFLSLMYTVLTPLLNPLIYSLRNEELRDVLMKYLRIILKT